MGRPALPITTGGSLSVALCTREETNLPVLAKTLDSKWLRCHSQWLRGQKDSLSHIGEKLQNLTAATALCPSVSSACPFLALKHTLPMTAIEDLNGVSPETRLHKKMYIGFTSQLKICKLESGRKLWPSYYKLQTLKIITQCRKKDLKKLGSGENL